MVAALTALGNAQPQLVAKEVFQERNEKRLTSAPQVKQERTNEEAEARKPRTDGFGTRTGMYGDVGILRQP